MAVNMGYRTFIISDIPSVDLLNNGKCMKPAKLHQYQISLLYYLEIQFCGPQQTVNQISARNIVLFTSSFFHCATHKNTLNYKCSYIF